MKEKSGEWWVVSGEFSESLTYDLPLATHHSPLTTL